MSDESIRTICAAAVIIVIMVCSFSALMGRWPWQKRD